MLDGVDLHALIAAAIFVAASITDWLDGVVARRRNQVTTLGTLLDPVADKLLVAAALVSLLAPYGATREAVLASGILWQAVLIVTGFAGLIVTQLLPRTAIAASPSAKEV